MHEETVIYRSRVDAWIVLLIVGILAAVLVAISFESWQSGDWRPLIFAAISMVFTCGILGVVMFPVRYELGHKILKVQSGVIKWEVPIESIREIRKTNNPLSAPAWSLKRIRIDYDNQGHPAWILISPEDRDGFIAQLEARQAAAQ